MATATAHSPLILSEALLAHAESQPRQLVLRFVEPAGASLADAAITTMNFGELNERAAAVASCLSQLAEADERVLVLCPPGIDYVAGLFGCFYAGLVAVPAYPPMGVGVDERLTLLFADSSPRVILTTEMFLPLLEGAGLPALARDAGVAIVTLDALSPADPDFTPRPLTPERLALLQYTSGSTGNPRGVMLSHANLVANVEAIVDHTGCTPNVDRGVFWLPPYHDMGLIGAIFTPVLAGGDTTLMSPLAFLADPLLWLETITQYTGTISAAPNFAYDFCVRKASDSRIAQLDLSRWRIAINGAEPVRAETMARFAERFAAAGFDPSSFMPCYGLAEATLLVTATSVGGGASTACLDPERSSSPSVTDAVSAGVPPTDWEIAIVDPGSGARCAVGDVGEIWVRGPSVASGYWGNPAATAATFDATLADDQREHGFLRTGDLGVMRDGELYVTGRLKDVIIVRGLNHYPADIEQTVADAEARLRKGCVTVFDLRGDGEQRLVAVAEVASTFDPAAVEEIGRNVCEAVSRAHRLSLSELVLIERGASLKTSSGKIRRAPTRQAYLSGELATVSSYEPRAAGRRAVSADGEAEGLAVMVASLFEEILGIESVTHEDDFLALGADSLSAVELAAMAGERGARIDPQDVYRFPTPRLLAGEIARRRADGGEAASARSELTHVLRSEIAPVADADSYPLSPIQRRWAADYLGDRDKTWGNLSLRFWLPDHGELGALEGAVETVWSAHEALRTVFVEVDGEPRQRVLESIRIPIREHDLTERAESERAGAVAQIVAAEAATRFELSTGPAARVALIRTGPTSAEAILTLHHMLADGWSLMELREQLLRAYTEAVSNGEPAPALSPPIRYRDYAAWMNGLEREGALSESRSYWLGELDGELPVTMPVDEQAARSDDAKGASHLVVLPSELAASLDELAVASRYSLSAWLLGAFFQTVRRRYGSHDSIIGTPLAGRDRQDIKHVVGMFINLVPIRLRFRRDWELRDVVAATHEKLVGAVAHQRYQLDSMMEDLGIAREPHQFAITNVFFTKIGMGQQKLGPQTGATVAAALPIDVRYQMMLYAYDFADGLVIDCRYRNSVHDPAEVEALVADYTAILNAAVR